MSAQYRHAVVAFVLALLVSATVADHRTVSAQGNRAAKPDRDTGVDANGIDQRMSGAGRLARLAATGKLDKMIARARAAHGNKVNFDFLSKEIDDGRDEAESPEDEGPTGGQAETSIAIDSTGQHVVVGINDTRGFGLNPVSISGFAYSDDGGATFTDGGQLPVTTGTSNIGTFLYPRVFGDPEVKYLGGSTFVYFSIMVKKTGSNSTAQTMGVHRSTDFGHTWQGPYEITPATLPHGTGDFADKEFADVDVETGRVMMTWSNFTSKLNAPGGVEISSTFSDNLATFIPPAVPSWSARTIIGNQASDGQMSIPRFAGNSSPGKTSNNVYVVWTRFVPNSNSRNIGFARSTDNGATFSEAANLNNTSDFFLSDEALGNDRSNNAPSLAVDTSGGTFHGSVYVVYPNNDNRDGDDVMFQRSTDEGVTFTPPMRLNSRPSTTLSTSDRSQWFPWVTVDKTTGRVYVFFYDQGIASDGDLTEATYLFSDDGGATWSKPMPLSDRPFHAGYGNDTGQPNLGDYIQGVAQNGAFSAVWAAAPPLVRFDDGNCTGCSPQSLSMTVPDMYYKRVAAGTTRISAALGTVAFTDSGGGPLGGNGFIDPGEQVSFTVPLRNYVTNPLMASTLTGVSATLSTSTAGVLVTQSGSAYPNLPGGTAYSNNTTAFVVSVGSTFVPGTHIEFSLAVTSAQGSTTLPFTIATGSPLATTLLSENFDASSSLPVGWSAVHVGSAGPTAVPWTTRTLSLGPSPSVISRAAFHIDANDGGGFAPTRWERLLSSPFLVPANSEYVTVDFDVAYDLEEESRLNVLAYDGLVLRLQDVTSGRMSRFVAAEAFAEEFKTALSNFYPRRLLQHDFGNNSYLEDLSAWSGNSRAGNAEPNGYRHVHLKLPGMAGSTAKLSFDYTQDDGFDCTSPRPGDACGVLVDNVVVQSVVSKQPTNVTVTSNINPSSPGQAVTFTATVTTANGTFPTDGTVTFKEGATVLSGPTTIVNGQASFTTSALSLGSHTITADYASTSGNFASASGSIVQQVAILISINDVSVTEGASGIQSANFTVSLSQSSASTITVDYATADGTATLADFDYPAASGTVTFTPGQTTRPLTVSFFGDSRYEANETLLVNLTNPTNALVADGQGVATILNDDPVGPTVNDMTVNQAIVDGAERLLPPLQHSDGGWSFVASSPTCDLHHLSCPNTIGVTALALLAAYERTGTVTYRDAAIVSGNAIVTQFNSTPPGLPHTQDIEFLMELATITGNPVYSTTAIAWFQVVKNSYASAADNVDQWLADRTVGPVSLNQRTLAAWDLASLIRTAKAAGDINYATGLATRIVQQESLWRDENPSDAPDPTNPQAFYFTPFAEGSLLWAFHDLPGFEPQINEYRSFLLTQQDPDGGWGGGDLQQTAYVVLGLAAVGGEQANAAIRSAMAFFLSHQNEFGGWPSAVTPTHGDPEITEVDSEIVRAMFTLFNTQSGSSITVSPAQLSSLTFATVTAPGMTSVFGITASRLPALPGGYRLLNGLAYQVTTTATIAGNVTICFAVPWVDDAGTFATVRILQATGATFVDRTVLAPDSPAPSFDSRRVCARTTSLGPFVIATRDVTPPAISVALTPSTIWPPNGKMVRVTATITASDDLDPAPRIELVSVVGNDAKGRGSDVGDAAIGSDDRQFTVRASPNAIYTVMYRATDAAGNSTEAVASVVVGK
jgi:hypothetical protein